MLINSKRTGDDYMNKCEKKKNHKATVETLSKEVKSIIKQLKNSEINCFCVPEEYKNNKNIIEVERQLGIRKLGRRGYDIIRNMFFVEEEFLKGVRTKKEITYFDDFETYSTFIDDDIYNNACYYQCNTSKIKTQIDHDRLNKRKSFVENTIDDYTVSLTDKEILLYEKGEQIKKKCKKWIDKFNNCSTTDEFREVEQNYRKSELSTELVGDTWDSYIQYRDFFMWQYTFFALNDKKRFNILMEYMSDYTCAKSLVREICAVFNPDDVMEAYAFTGSSKPSMHKQKKRLKDIVVAIKNGLIAKSVTAFFDEVSHYYCEKCTYVLQEEQTCQSEGMGRFSTYRYFETFESFIKYRNGDLTNCDLTKAIKLNYDFTKCKTNDTTKLPLANMDNLNYVIKKKYFNNRFNVLQAWYSSDGVHLKHYTHTFDYFFDFVAFMKGDLSDADLLFCDGLQNLDDISGINFKNARITSTICDKLGIQYESYKVDNNRLESFFLTEENEKSTELVLQTSRELATSDEISNYDIAKEQIYYVSDIHLLHKLEHFGPKSKADVIYVIKSIVYNIVKESGNTILIGGDISSDFSIFELFIRILRSELDSRRRSPLVILVLGNHELWEFPQNSFDEIITKYNDLIDECGMYLLQNNILYKDSEKIIHRITTEEILSLEDKELREKIRTSRMTFFGGLAFSGYNEEFNANRGIYRDTINKAAEIKETKKFEKLYEKVCSTFFDKNLVVFTHMPMDCWSESVNYHKNFIYVSGHTHRNYFYDDGDIRVYADNQLGYKNNKLHMKWFDLENDYDCFVDYQDGIYEITSHEYQEFNRGKNIMINFNRKVNILYMLKKNGYYCFIHESEGGSLTILNGGALKKLDIEDINYYYENMDSVIALIRKPLDAYTNIQKAISTEIQKIGGSGYIHGCIVDINRFNHVYVNPFDMKITSYWASDIINKKIYPTLLALLKKECPILYARYTKLLKENSKNFPILGKKKYNDLATLPQNYFDTDIYKASREIKKMQKLSSNILTKWYEIDNTNKMLGLKSNI